MSNPTFDQAAELFAAFLQYCEDEGIFVAVDETGAVCLYDTDSVLNVAEQEFPDHDDPILALTETWEGTQALTANLGYFQAGYVDMVF
jgi:hypothetical protein